MNNKIYVGVDNGVTGALTFIFPDKQASFYKTPIKNCLNYTKKKAFLNRVDIVKLEEIFTNELGVNRHMILAIERPMVNPGRWNATISGIRALEASLTVFERLNIPFRYIDSEEWQRWMLPTGLGGEELKKASSEVSARLFPHLKQHFKKDGDSALIAEYLRQKELNPKTL